MDKKKSEFDKVFSAWDILVIAFGAMIGWGWEEKHIRPSCKSVEQRFGNHVSTTYL